MGQQYISTRLGSGKEQDFFGETSCGTLRKMPSNLHFGQQIVGHNGPWLKSDDKAHASIGRDMQMGFQSLLKLTVMNGPRGVD